MISNIDPRRNNYVEPEVQEPVIEEELVEQPTHHLEPIVPAERTVEIGNFIYNRPIYIRKMKKIAEEYNFSQ